jgi:hypothetical protein
LARLHCTVLVQSDGKEIFRKDNVKTRPHIGFATSFETTIDICLPSKKLSEEVQRQLVAATFVGVSIEQGKITYRISNQPFRYL